NASVLRAIRSIRLRSQQKITMFFQAEAGLRDRNVTGVQTCALPISICSASDAPILVAIGASLAEQMVPQFESLAEILVELLPPQIGRASCRERGLTRVAGEAVSEGQD